MGARGGGACRWKQLAHMLHAWLLWEKTNSSLPPFLPSALPPSPPFFLPPFRLLGGCDVCALQLEWVAAHNTQDVQARLWQFPAFSMQSISTCPALKRHLKAPHCSMNGLKHGTCQCPCPQRAPCTFPSPLQVDGINTGCDKVGRWPARDCTVTQSDCR